MLTRFTSGEVAITTYNDLRDEARGIREHLPASMLRGIDLWHEDLQHVVGFRVAGRDVFRSLVTHVMGPEDPRPRPSADGMTATLIPCAVPMAVGAVMAVRAAAVGRAAEWYVNEYDGPSLRLRLEPMGDTGSVGLITTILRRRSNDAEERFGSMPVADLATVWSAYGNHVRAAALEVIPELAEHEHFGRWFREGDAAIAAGWNPYGPWPET